MVCDRRNERVVRGRGIGIPRNYWKERLPGRFSLEQIAADLPAGSLISLLRVKLHALFQSLPLSLSSYAILFIASRLPPFTRSFGKTVRETMAAIRLCSLFIPTALCFFRTRSSSLELSEKRVARSRRKDLAIPTVLIPHRSRKFRLIRATRVAVFP